MEHCLFLMNLDVIEVWNIVYPSRGMEHCLFLISPELWNIVYSNEPRGMEHCLFLIL